MRLYRILRIFAPGGHLLLIGKGRRDRVRGRKARTASATVLLELWLHAGGWLGRPYLAGASLLAGLQLGTLVLSWFFFWLGMQRSGRTSRRGVRPAEPFYWFCWSRSKRFGRGITPLPFRRCQGTCSSSAVSEGHRPLVSPSWQEGLPSPNGRPAIGRHP